MLKGASLTAIVSAGLMKDAFIDLSNNKITRMTQDLWQPVFDQVINGMVDLRGENFKKRMTIT